ncbi:hypothetical protein, partial [Rubritalea halochordaticola]|uniref:hypothetical protein n=1 Tax=Rubritalea halochordaticola TaxID=714537 RepID=UPI0031FE04EC
RGVLEDFPFELLAVSSVFTLHVLSLVHVSESGHSLARFLGKLNPPLPSSTLLYPPLPSSILQELHQGGISHQ